ncbi:hypothetical protein EZV73_11725 [Acidaminobacter sp. JC074]|uniref:SoxR reducing system RseC family protein n=1 Tax=Acidaminobacter sp. JC074 TaxID=2530199 RepID=UPI001F0F37A3|nr:SoxR reducing system RseC family protein [Acidaminobacter sp. JC074]MCH4888248.1 hypothetical protein [Acidaminobacter sp. JC074]
MITTGVVVKVEDEKAYVHIARNTACENCGACHFDEKTLNMQVTAVNHAGAKVGDQVELSMENVNFFRASFFLYGIPLITLLVGLFSGIYLFQSMGLKLYDVYAILLGLAFMAVTYIILRMNKDKFADNKRYMSVITGIKHHGELPVI